MGYTRNEIIVMAQEASKDISTFYKSKFINYRGITSDTHEYYTEVVAEWLLLNMNVLDGIKPIPREASYYTPSHDGFKSEINVNTGRLMYSKKDADELANLIDNAIMLYISESKK